MKSDESVKKPSTSEKAKALEAKQLRFARHWEKQYKPPIPDDQWPREWHAANRWRCINDHVRVGVTRLHGCRECARKSNRNVPDVPVVRTAPSDETGPFDFDAELAMHQSTPAPGKPPSGSQD